MTTILAILAAAVVFALFGYFGCGIRRACGSGCSCVAQRQDDVCGAYPQRGESDHAKS